MLRRVLHSEFFGKAHFEHPQPLPLGQLRALFDSLDPSHDPICTPNKNGETIDELHDRIAYTLYQIVTDLDSDPSQPKTLLICTHAASMIAIGRALTGKMPGDADTPDFKAYTASLSRYTRRTFELPGQGPAGQLVKAKNDDVYPKVDWKDFGIKGNWNCVQNGYTDFLSKGAERGW